MKEWLYLVLTYIARFHDWILTLDDGLPVSFSDKQLHFLVIGVFGMLLFVLIHPLFKLLIRRNLTIVVSLLYVFTLVLSASFAIEIGQYLTRTGKMDLGDIVSGLRGFLVMCGIWLLIRLAVKAVRRHRPEE